jgi:putative membrane-bound dehydrogenase-like protein
MNNTRALFVIAGLVATFGVARGQNYPAEEAVRQMKIAAGLEATLVAAEPAVRQPILVKCDDRGRLWVIQYLQYPNPAGLTRKKVDEWSRTEYDRVPEPPPHGPNGADRITICTDIDGDGRADSFKDFVTGLNLCTSLEFGFGGVFVIQAPYLLFYPDRDADDVPDGDPEVLLTGFGMEDSQSLANHLTWGPDGWLYGVNGSTTTCRIRGIEFQQGVWRYHPVTHAFELFCEGGGNPYGLTFDAAGRLIYSSNGGLCHHAVQGGYLEKNFGKHGPLHNPHAYGWFGSVRHTGLTGRPNTGGTIYLAETFPERYRGTFMCGDFLGHTCSWWTVTPEASTVGMKLGGLLIDSRDASFGPTDLCLGPAGEIYVADFFDKRTAHPDPDADWDTDTGRIYRIDAIDSEGRTRNDAATRRLTGIDGPIDIRTLPDASLVALLRHPNHWFRTRARVEIAGRRSPSLKADLQTAVLEADDPDFALQCLWALHAAGGMTDETAAALLEHPDPVVREWAVRLLGDEDGRALPDDVARRLSARAEAETSIGVRCQMAATAKRLDGADSLRLVEALSRHATDATDPRIPLMLWWALERHSLTSIDDVVRLFATPDAGSRPALRQALVHLVRRYASEGSAATADACLILLKAAPPDRGDEPLRALAQGLGERSAKNSVLFDGDLLDYVRRRWQAEPRSPLWLEIALHAGVNGAARELGRMVDSPASDGPALEVALGLMGRFGAGESLPAVIPLVDAARPDAVQRLALTVVGRSVDPVVTAHLLHGYAALSPARRAQVRDILLSRPASAAALLDRVDAGEIAPSEFTQDQLQRVSLLKDAAVDRLVAKHWGLLQGASSGETLADIRRFTNDLRAAPGNREAGKALYAKHCGVCHTLFGEGNHIGPDLTKANRGDRAALLRNIVDPSHVIRKEYVSFVVTTNDGQVNTGLLAEQDAASVTLLNARNERTRIPRSDVDSLDELPVSLMPTGLLHPLSPQERRDLFAYLQVNPDAAASPDARP